MQQMTNNENTYGSGDVSDMGMTELVFKYNEIAKKLGTPEVGPKTFNSRKTAIERIRKLMARLPAPTHGGDEPEPAPEPTPKAKHPLTRERTEFRTVREMAEHFLLKPISYKTILRLVGAYFPEASTTVKCLRWYATQMRDRGEAVPTRPRSPSADELARFPK